MNDKLLAIKRYENKHDDYKGKIVSHINDTYGTKITALMQLVSDKDGTFVSEPLGGWPEEQDDMAIALKDRVGTILSETLDALVDGKISVPVAEEEDEPRVNPYAKSKPTVVETIGVELPLGDDVFGDAPITAPTPTPKPDQIGAELVELISKIGGGGDQERMDRLEQKLDAIIDFQRKCEENFPFLK